MGTIVLSLPPSISSQDASQSSPEHNASTQVRILSICNTLSRLLLGPIADFISPTAPIVRRKLHSSRIVFLFGAALLVSATCVWMILGVRDQGGLWALRSVSVRSIVKTKQLLTAWGWDCLTVPYSQCCELKKFLQATCLTVHPAQVLCHLSLEDPMLHETSGSSPTLPSLEHQSTPTCMHILHHTILVVGLFAKVAYVWKRHFRYAQCHRY
jgi:hypothetical protein